MAKRQNVSKIKMKTIPFKERFRPFPFRSQKKKTHKNKTNQNKKKNAATTVNLYNESTCVHKFSVNFYIYWAE